MILVADNINILNRRVAAAVEKGNPEPIRVLARRCEQAGADALDINSGPLGRGAEQKMSFLVQAVQSASDLPVLLDTANAAAMEAGLKANRKRAIINGFSLEPAKLGGILPLARRFETDIVGYLLRPDSAVPRGEEERMRIAVELFGRARAEGVSPERLLIDPVVVPLSWQDGHLQNRTVLSLIRRLPDLLGYPVRTVAGLSNLTSGSGGARQKQVMSQAFLSMLAGAGLHMVLLNVMQARTMAVAKACCVLMADKAFAWTDP
jgi:5-methyltetrahydrofolate corrinoid/iron sulfur protein methyltransferase